MKHSDPFPLAPLLLALLALAASPRPARAGEAERAAWPAADFQYRWLIEVDREPKDAGDQGTVAFTFAPGGHLAADGTNVEVTDLQGTVLPSRLLPSAPEREALVAFPTKPKGTRLWGYYGGNAKSVGQKAAMPEPSLTLTTWRKTAEGGMQDLAGLKKRLGAPDGSGLVEQVWHGINPYGEDDGFVSRFSGWLRVEKPGKYYIFTISDDASFVLLDGQEAAAWPGHHGVGGGQGGEQGRELNLSAGLHRLEYWQGEDGGDQMMILGWQPPGAAKREIIPAAAFVHAGKAHGLRLERRDDRPLAAAEVSQEGAVVFREVTYLLVRGRALGELPAEPAGLRRVWRFSDGMEATGDETRHVFIGNGPYAVRLDLRGPPPPPAAAPPTPRRPRLRIDLPPVTPPAGRPKVSPTPTPPRPPPPPPEPPAVDRFRRSFSLAHDAPTISIENETALRRLVEVALADDLARAAPEHLERLWALVELLADPAPRVRLAETAAARYAGTEAAAVKSRRAWQRRQAEALRASDPARAYAVYHALYAETPESARAEALELGLALLELLAADPARRAELDGLAAELERRCAGLPGAHLVAVRRADALLAERRYEEAAAAYAAAQPEEFRRLGETKGALLQNSYAATAKSEFAADRVDLAEATLARWEREFPQARMSAPYVVLRARTLLARQRAAQARAELERQLEWQPLAAELPELKYLLGAALAATGEAQRARELLENVVKEYPSHPAAAEARRRLERLR